MPRALISVSDKRGIVPFAQGLVRLGWEIISTGGTAAALQAAGVPVLPVDQVTGSPEILDGRVKTLHPKIHGGLLFRRDLPSHAARRVRSFILARIGPDNGQVTIDAEAGTVTLRGVVGSFWQRQLWLSGAQRVAGVIRVIDEIEVT